jgi:hypothetical protein
LYVTVTEFAAHRAIWRRIKNLCFLGECPKTDATEAFCRLDLHLKSYGRSGRCDTCHSRVHFMFSEHNSCSHSCSRSCGIANRVHSCAGTQFVTGCSFLSLPVFLVGVPKSQPASRLDDLNLLWAITFWECSQSSPCEVASKQALRKSQPFWFAFVRNFGTKRELTFQTVSMINIS